MNQQNQTLVIKILTFFKKNPTVRLKPKKLQSELKISHEEYPDLRDTIKQLARRGKLQQYPGNVYGLPDQTDLSEIVGVLDIHARGFGFVTTPGGQKIFIHADNLGNACHGDTVRVRLIKRKRGDNPEGIVIRVLKRGRNEFVCIYRKVRGYSLGIPETTHLRKDVVITDLNGFDPEDGSIISVEITDWRDTSRRPHGRITRLIGSRNTKEFDAVLVANQYGIPDRFPSKVLEQAESLTFSLSLKGREDFRNWVSFTIDPEDARDYDDALSIRENPDSSFLLGVHIADVSHYIPEDSPIDKEALKRGTSVYFTRYVIPMLPEKLSNELCSLNPHEDRLTFSVIMTITPKGEVIQRHITPSVIRSNRRFTYQEVQKILEDGKGDYYSEISSLYKLATILNKVRSEAGSIDFDVPEPQYILDDSGFPTEIYQRERLGSHRIVEECMLIANKTVAEYINRQPHPLPFIYRVHEQPKPEETLAFFSLLKSFGFENTVKGRSVRPADFRDALLAIKETDLHYFLEKIALRTMMKAQYDTKPLGHFGLAFREYTHFTSPIRRYPDLVIHRLLHRYLQQQAISDEKGLLKKLDNIAKKSTDCEIRAQNAEREYHKIKQIKYLEKHLGEVFQGLISGVVQFGFYVEIPETLVEGFVHRKFLPPDYWQYDGETYSLIGQRTKQRFRMGDRVNVRVVRVSLAHMEVDFYLVKDNKKTSSKNKIET